MKSALYLAAGALTLGFVAGAAEKPAWNPQAAASYLDQRAAWWATWKNAARDHDTFCVSCHTVLPYALGRPALRQALGETEVSPGEQRILENVRRRVRLWSEVEPFYNDAQRGVPKSAESRTTEAILNALILVNYDARSGAFRPETRQALDYMLALQYDTGEQPGAWNWLNFRNQPWEADDSQYWGTTLAAVALGSAPDDYRSTAPVRDAIRRVSRYLLQQETRQSTLNRLGFLWAAAKTPGLLESGRKDAIVREVIAKQQPDGGWSASSLLAAGWTRKDGTPLDQASDGYGTGIAAFILQQSGMPRNSTGIALALRWLETHQDQATGQFPASSPNKQRDPASDAGRFMSDAATAYAALALERR